MNDDDDDEENANLLKMAVQEKYDSKDLRLLTKMDISIPMKTSDLKHHVKFFRAVLVVFLDKRQCCLKVLKGPNITLKTTKQDMIMNINKKSYSVAASWIESTGESTGF